MFVQIVVLYPYCGVFLMLLLSISYTSLVQNVRNFEKTPQCIMGDCKEEAWDEVMQDVYFKLKH
jgi:hypothetical protein